MPALAAPANDDSHRLRIENEHLRLRVAQLQGQVWDLSGRLAQALLTPEPMAPGAGIAVALPTPPPEPLGERSR